MNLNELLEKSYSKKNNDFIISGILNGQLKMEELMECFFSKDLRICQRASYAVGMISGKQSELLTPYMPAMLQALDSPLHNAISRNVVRSWQNMDIVEEYAGEVFEKCFNFFNDAKEAIAVRAFSVEVCLKICKKYPDVKTELIEMMALHFEKGSPGLKHKIKKALKELS